MNLLNTNVIVCVVDGPTVRRVDVGRMMDTEMKIEEEYKVK